MPRVDPPFAPGEVEPRTAINAANTPGDARSVFKITQPGSYYLTANPVDVSGKHGILVTVPGVSIDLAGNLIIRNRTAGSPTPFDLAPGNAAGPTVNSATILTNTSPHANYAY